MPLAKPDFVTQINTSTTPKPTFIVTVNKSTLHKSYDVFSDALKKTPVAGVNFTIIDSRTLRISINPGITLDKSADITFRSAVGKVNANSLTTKQTDEILQAYDRFLEEYKLVSDYTRIKKQTSETHKATSQMAY